MNFLWSQRSVSCVISFHLFDTQFLTEYGDYCTIQGCWLANFSDPPASLPPSTRIELLCWAFCSGTTDLSSGLWLAWKLLTELISTSPQLHQFLLPGSLLVGEWTETPSCMSFRDSPWLAAPTCNPADSKKLFKPFLLQLPPWVRPLPHVGGFQARCFLRINHCGASAT